MQINIKYTINASFDDKEITTTGTTSIEEENIKEFLGDSIYEMSNQEILDALLEMGYGDIIEEMEAEYLAHNEFKNEYEAENMFPWVEITDIHLDSLTNITDNRA